MAGTSRCTRAPVHRTGLYRSHVKRLLDVTVSVSALVLLAPLLLATGIAVRVKLGRPVLFRQPRPGLGERVFEICKFRTLTEERGTDGRLLPDEARLTGFGRWLRSTSIDELPELFNVVKGDMSLVGPRPLLVDYLPLYTPTQRRRHDVRPGLTGLAQVRGRNMLSWEEKFEADVEYVDSYSLCLDVTIIAQTVASVLRREGISQEGSATVGAFSGSVQDG